MNITAEQRDAVISEVYGELLKAFTDAELGQGTESKSYWRLHNLNQPTFFRLAEMIQDMRLGHTTRAHQEQMHEEFKLAATYLVSAHLTTIPV